MTTPTNEHRDTDRAENTPPEPQPLPETQILRETQPRHRFDLSVTKVAAGACAAALAAAVGSKLGVGGTIVGAAVASAVATSASAVIGHSLERGKTAARKAMPVALTALDETRMKPSLADRALADSEVDETVVLPKAAPADAKRTWKKPLIAAGLVSFLIGTGAVTALEVARKGEFPGYHSNVFTNDPGQSSGSNNQPSPENSGGSTHVSTTPSQKPTSPSPTPSGSSSSSPSSIPTTPTTSDSPSSTPSTSSSPSPTTTPSGSASPTTTPGTAGPTAPSSSAGGQGKATPTGGPTG